MVKKEGFIKLTPVDASLFAVAAKMKSMVAAFPELAALLEQFNQTFFVATYFWDSGPKRHVFHDLICLGLLLV